jgi:hypothetical protein
MILSITINMYSSTPFSPPPYFPSLLPHTTYLRYFFVVPPLRMERWKMERWGEAIRWVSGSGQGDLIFGIVTNYGECLKKGK